MRVPFSVCVGVTLLEAVLALALNSVRVTCQMPNLRDSNNTGGIYCGVFKLCMMVGCNIPENLVGNVVYALTVTNISLV